MRNFLSGMLGLHYEYYDSIARMVIKVFSLEMKTNLGILRFKTEQGQQVLEN